MLHGIVPPLISPLDDAGAPDADAMAAPVEHVVGAGAADRAAVWALPEEAGAARPALAAQAR